MDLLRICYGINTDLLTICYVFAMAVLLIYEGFAIEYVVNLLKIEYAFVIVIL